MLLTNKMLFSTVKSTSAYLWLFVLFRFGCAQDVSTEFHTKYVDGSTSGLPTLATTVTPTRTIIPWYIRHRRTSSSDLLPNFCSAPPQPINGEWKLNRLFCEKGVNSTIDRGTKFGPGTQLTYRCNHNYRAKGNTEVYCMHGGKWSPIPSCNAIKCESLDSASTIVSCNRFGKWVDCDSPVLPQTQAEVTCHYGYKEDMGLKSARRESVTCKMNGNWEPEPIRCVPVCGLSMNQQTEDYGGSMANIRDVPWHATLYLQTSRKEKKKDFICGATIIRTNVVLTAAHCVYDEKTDTTMDPGTLFLMTGNIFRDYDSSFHDPRIVKKAAVKNVYMPCNYYGHSGNYTSDIALLELQYPFELSSIFSPACLDNSGDNEQFLESGVFGRVAGFRRTVKTPFSAILQTISLPYVSNSQCKSSNDTTQNEIFISNDKFCAGYNDGSVVCRNDSGGGLVFKKGPLWYVMGIVSMGLGVDMNNGERTCKKHSYSLYTKVSTYTSWIHDVLFHVERNRPYPSCSHHSKMSMVTSATLTSGVTSRSVTKPNSASPVMNWWDNLTAIATTASPGSTVTSRSVTRADHSATPVTNWWDNPTTAMTPSVTRARVVTSSCLAPPQPVNGEWKLHQDSCGSILDCKIAEGTNLQPGSQLVYSCAPGFKADGITSVYCVIGGRWTSIPTCTPDRSCQFVRGESCLESYYLPQGDRNRSQCITDQKVNNLNAASNLNSTILSSSRDESTSQDTSPSRPN